MASALGDTRLEAQASTFSGLALQHLGRLERAQQELGNAVRLAREAADLDIERQALTFLAVTELHVGHLEQSRKHYEQVTKIARTIGDRNWEAMTVAVLGFIDFHLGRWNVAREELERAAAMQEAPLYASFPRRWLAQLSAAQGKWEDAADHLTEARKTHGSARLFPHLRGPDSLTTEWKLVGAPEPALDGAGQAAPNGTQPNAAHLAFEAWNLLAQNDHEGAEEHAGNALNQAIREQHVLSQIDAHRAYGMVLATRGQERWNDAVQSFDQAIALAQEMKDPYSEGRSRCEYGRALLEAGNRDRAREQLTQAQSLLSSLGEVPYLHRTEEALARL
jgi:tetratricopeptide (TPR) repeat protein